MRSKKWLAHSKARFAALQALYQWDQLKDELSLDEVRDEFIQYRFQTDGYNPIDAEFFVKLLQSWQEHHDVVDAYISEHLSENWRLERLASPLRALLRLVVTEVHYFSTPPSVAWAEYQELARAFIDDNDIAFVVKFMGTLLPEKDTESRPT